MKHMVITIGCEYGAGGPEIGKMLAQALGIEYYDRDLVDKIVNDLDVDKELVEKADKATNVPYTFETTLGPRYANLTNRVISLQYQAMHKMAEEILLRHHRTQRELSAARQRRSDQHLHLRAGRGPNPRGDGASVGKRGQGTRNHQL